MTHFKKHIILLLLVCLPFLAFSQAKGVKISKNSNTEKTRILFIVDCSYNMYEKWQSDTKIKITQSLISNLVDTLSEQERVEVALRVFGSETDYSSQDCDDTHLLVPFYRLNADALKAKLKALVPRGTSAVAKSLEKAQEDFPKEKNSRNIVIMIVDNIDKCDGNIAEISKDLQKKGVFIKPFIVGISKGMKNFYQDCGSYYEASNEVEFTKVLNDIAKQALHNTTAQVNLLDSYMEVTETNIPITFYDSQSKNLRYSIIHTFNKKGLSDTISLDPLVNYDVIVHTIPAVKVENVKIAAGSHTIIPMQTPQGNMIVKYVASKVNNAKDYPIVVKKAGAKETINIQEIGKKEKYLVGKYDLEVLSLPRLYLENVEIGQSSTTTIEIPLPGNLHLDKGKTNMVGALFVKDKQETRWVKNLDEESMKENIELMPGEYMVVIKDKSAVKTTDTIVKEIKIESSKTTNVTLSKK